MYFQRKNKKNVIIPFKLVNNLIVFPMRVNNSGIMYFILDSGVRTPIITDLGVNDSIILKTIRKQYIQGLGEGEPVEVLFSTNNNFSISDIVQSDLNAFMLTENIFNLSSKMGTQINGIIGYDIFSNFVVEVDYIKEKLILHNPDLYKHRVAKRKVQLPLTIQNKKVYINTRIEQNDGSIVPVKLLVDTGSSLALWISLQSNDKLYLPEKHEEAYLGKGLNGDIYGKQSRIKAVYIEKYKLENPTTSFPDSTSVMNTVRLDGRNGSLGAEVLRRFRVIIDYQRKSISFYPNHNMKDEFYYDMSGIEINVPYPDLPIFVIFKIKEGSPADLAGLKVNDQIMSIYLKDNTDLTLNEIHSYFQSKPGKKVSIIVLRDNKRIKTELILRQDI